MKPSVAFVTTENYRNFHGMLCQPSTAQCCVDSFTGSILFMPHDYTTPSNYDFSRPLLTVGTYYLLVLISFTGLSTLLGATKFQCAEEYNADQVKIITTPLASKSDPSLIFREDCWNHVYKQCSCNTLRLLRRFEYEFLWGNLSVVMLHLMCENNKLHLVEVYRWKVPLIGKFFKTVFEEPSCVVRRMVRVGHEGTMRTKEN